MPSTKTTKVTDDEAVALFEDGSTFDPAQARGPERIEAIRAAVAARDLVDQLVTERVQAAREAGLTWVEIALGLGVSPQGARQRYGQPKTRGDGDLKSTR